MIRSFERGPPRSRLSRYESLLDEKTSHRISPISPCQRASITAYLSRSAVRPSASRTDWIVLFRRGVLFQLAMASDQPTLAEGLLPRHLPSKGESRLDETDFALGNGSSPRTFVLSQLPQLSCVFRLEIYGDKQPYSSSWRLAIQLTAACKS